MSSFDYSKTARRWLLGEAGFFREVSQLTRLTDLVKGMNTISEADKAQKKKVLALLEKVHREFDRLVEQKTMLEEQITILEERS